MKMTKNTLFLRATNKELQAKIDSLNKSIEANKKMEKELQVMCTFPNHFKTREEFISVDG